MNNPDILLALKDVLDPELGLNIVDLGLVYRAEWTREGIVVEMTMTTPTCPIGEMMTEQAEIALRRQFPDAASIRVHLLWDPPWSPDLMTEEGRRLLGGIDLVADAPVVLDASGWKH